MSSLDFWSSPDEPAVISLGKMPGAMQLTRILASAKVVAIIRVRWMKPEMKGKQASLEEPHDFEQGEVPALDVA